MIPYVVKHAVFSKLREDLSPVEVYDTFPEAHAAAITENLRVGARVWYVQPWKVPIMLPPRLC